MTEIAIPQTQTTDLAGQVEYAKLISAGSLLPDTYRGKPANVLIAMGLGQAMGLSPAESLYRIAVIKGKPSASAELIAANVRKAGHKLRVQVSEDPPAARCTIIRHDDPEDALTITRDMAWAQRMGLANEPNYKKQPSTMLANRAITACARLQCPEALYGVANTAEEVGDLPGTQAPTGGLAAALASDPEPTETPEADEPIDGELLEEQP